MPSRAQIEGQALVPAIGFSFDSNEKDLSPVTVATNIVDLIIPVNQTKRTIWCGIWANASVATDFFVLARVDFLRMGRNVGSLPIAFGSSPAGGGGSMPRSLASASGANNVPGDNTLAVSLANISYVAQKQWFLWPFQITSEADEVTLSIQSFNNVTAIRIFFGILSNAL